MSETKRPLKVFLCHAHDDKLKTRELYRYLRKRGIQPWLDAEDLVGGQDWRVEIPKAIRTSDAIIICLSKNSINKEGFVQAEITFALEKALEVPQGRIFIIPARFEDCEVPNNLEHFHWVDLFEEDGFPRLMKSLRTRASQLERSNVQVSQPDETTPNLNFASEEKIESEAALERIEREAAEKAAREKTEKEAAEKAERERKEKEFSEKQAREAREKEKRKTEKKEEKPTTIKPKSGGQIAYWAGGFIVLVLGIIFLSSLNNTPSTPQPTPENTQTQAIATLAQDTTEPSPTATPKSTSTPASTLESTVISDKPQKLYFFSEDKYLSVIDVFSKQSKQMLPINIDNQTPFWLNDSELAIWSGRDMQVVNIESNTTRIIDGSDYKYVNSVSDISNSGKLAVIWGEIFSIASFNNDGSLIPPLGVELDATKYRQLFCMRWRPDSSMIALIVVGLNARGYALELPPDLAILRVGPGETPIIIKKQVDGCISWSPDGKYIVYGNGKPRWNDLNLDNGVYYVDITSGSVTKLTDTNGYYPVWSPDGKTIAFLTDKGISLIDVNTKEESQIYSGNVLALLWGK